MADLEKSQMGSYMASLIDEDIAHIERAMRLSFAPDCDSNVLPAGYWRRRLHQLLDTVHLNKAQLRGIDALLLQLDRLEAEAARQLKATPKRAETIEETSAVVPLRRQGQ